MSGPASDHQRRPSTRPARQRSRCAASDHAASRRLRCTVPVASRSTAQQPAAALPVGAGPGLRPAGRPVVRRVAGRAPGARGRATGQSAQRGLRGRADQGAELHHRDRPGRRGRRRPRAAAPRRASRSAGVTDAGGNSTPAEHPGEHPAHVGVEHGVPPAVGEHRDRRGGVVADPGQRAAGRRTTPAPRRRAARRSRRAAACSRSARRG